MSINNEDVLSEFASLFDRARLGQRPSVEFEWFAIDRVAQIAVFSTAGFGRILHAVCEDKAGYLAVVRWALSLESTAVPSYEGQQEEADWNGWVPKGLFWFDNPSDWRSPYVRCGVPSATLNVEHAPEPVLDHLSRLKWSSLQFELLSRVVDRLFESSGVPRFFGQSINELLASK